MDNVLFFSIKMKIIFSKFKRYSIVVKKKFYCIYVYNVLINPPPLNNQTIYSMYVLNPSSMYKRNILLYVEEKH
jgi:hypothetical protein